MELKQYWEKIPANYRKVLVIGGAVIAGLISILLINNGSQYSEVISQVPQPEEVKIPEQQPFFAEITGAVKKPGVYELERSVMVIELIELAGGLSEFADMLFVHEQLNLSSLVEEGQKVFVPPLGSYSKTTRGAEKVNINTASAEQLETISGIGPAMAKKIIENRPYMSLEELQNVPGIGEATYNKIVTDLTI